MKQKIETLGTIGIYVIGVFAGIIGIIYTPIYLTAYIVHKIARLILALCYILMFRWRIAVDIVKDLFKWYGKH